MTLILITNNKLGDNIMNNILKSFQVTTLGACLAVALAVGAVSTTANADTDEVRAAQAAKLTVKQAIDTARKSASGTLVSAEFDDDDDNAQGGVYEIEFNTDTTNYEVKVDAITGQVISTETERLDSGDIADYKTQQQAKIDIMNAMSIAEKETSGQIMEIEFKNDRDYADHTSYYEVEVLKGSQIMELNVDADTGAVFGSKVKS